MKNIAHHYLTLAIIFVLSTLASQAQTWTRLNPHPTFQSLFSVCFPSVDTGYITGSNSTVLRTYDGGATWTELNFPLSGMQIRNVNFINNDTGYIAMGGAVYYTHDAGENWSYATVPGMITALENTAFYNDTIGFSFGYYGSLAKTMDGGISWERLNYAPTSIEVFNNVQFANDTTGYLAGQNEFSGTAPIFRRTDDGGHTWNDIAIPEGIRSVADVAVISPDNIWIGAGNATNNSVSRLYHSIDGGASWVVHDVGGSNGSSGIEKIKFFNENEGYALNHCHIYKTTDGGETWSDILLYNYINKNLDLKDFSWPDPNRGYFCGYDPSLLKTTDGGGSFDDLISGSINPNHCIYFNDSLNGNLLGYEGNTGFIYHTTDGGDNWLESTVHSTSGQVFTYIDLAYSSSLNGWATTFSSTLFKTTDGGINWYELPTGLDAVYNKICTPTTGSIFLAGLEGNVVKSFDQGNSWIDISLGLTNYQSTGMFLFTDTLTGFIVLKENGTNIFKFMKTVNSGADWTEINYNYTNSIYSMSFADSLSGMISLDNKKVMVTHDGGASWSLAAFNQPYSINKLKMFNPSTGIAITGGDRVAITYDGGANFEVVYEGSNGWPYINSSFFLNENLGWACGGQGMIMRYERLETGNYFHNKEQKSNSGDDFFFPNPAKNKIHITSSDFTQLTFTNQNGMKVNLPFINGANEIDISALSPGVYIVTLYSNKGIRHQKLIKY